MLNIFVYFCCAAITHLGVFKLLIDNVSKYDYIIVLHLPMLPLPVTAKQREVIIPGDQPEEGIDGMKDC